MTDLTREKIAELRALIEKRAWTHDDDYRVRQLVPALLAAASLSAGEPDGMETTAEERAHWLDLYAEKSFDKENTPMLLRALHDVDRLLAREAKAREEEREACAKIADDCDGNNYWKVAEAIRARTTPDLQSEIGLRAHLADLSARGLKP